MRKRLESAIYGTFIGCGGGCGLRKMKESGGDEEEEAENGGNPLFMEPL